MTTYLVTGFMRSGTSMMMRALFEGLDGVDMVVDETRKEKLNKGEYIPNHEYLEPPLSAFETPEFPRQYEGQLLKCLMAGMHPLWPLEGGYRVVQLWRDPRVIRKSWEMAGDAFPPPPGWLPDGYMVRMAACSAMLKNRRDVISHHDLWFPDVLDDPVGVFQMLKDDGWPIDVEKAAAVVDPTKQRAA